MFSSGRSAPEAAVGELDRTLILRPHLKRAHELRIGKLHARVRLRVVHAYRHWADVAAGLRDHGVARPVAEVVEVKADLGEEDKAVADKLPIRLADLEAHQVLLQVSLNVPSGEARCECHARPEIGSEMDVLDAADVGAL